MKVIDPVPTFTAQMRLDDYQHPTAVVRVKPKRFLELALPKDSIDNILEPSVYNQQSLQNLHHRLQSSLDIDPPSLEVDSDTNEVVNHSGRHRALTAYRMGLKTIPVLLYYVRYCKDYMHNIKKSFISPPKEIHISKLKPETFRRPHEVQRYCD